MLQERDFPVFLLVSFLLVRSIWVRFVAVWSPGLFFGSISPNQQKSGGGAGKTQRPGRGGDTTCSSNSVNSRSGFVSLIRHDHVLAAVQKVPDSSQVSRPKGRAQNSFYCLKNQANEAQIRTKGAEGRQSSNSTKAKGKSFSMLVSFPLCFQKTQLHPPPDEIKLILRLATSLSR